MKLPVDDRGRRYVSITQFRRYGATDHHMAGYESVPGCPRQYHALYIEGRPGSQDPVLIRGRVVHAVLEYMEVHDCGPEEALTEVWPAAELDQADWVAMTVLLNDYLDRGGPMTRYGTLGTELELWTPLFEDAEGPVWFRVILDWIGVDPDDDGLLHVVDYKSQWRPPTMEQVRGDVQLMGQAWAVEQNWGEWFPDGPWPPKIVVHLDAVRYRDMEHRFSPADLEQWRDWAIATTRAIMSDMEAKPRLNWGCSRCPVSSDCPVILGLPERGGSIAERAAGGSWGEKWAWRVKAAEVRDVLTAKIAEIDGELTQATLAADRLEFADQAWTVEPQFVNHVDLVRLHELLGTDFYNLVSVTKQALVDYARGLPASDGAVVRNCLTREPSGTRVKKGKR